MELNESECEVLPANKPAWGDLPRRMPALRALKVQILEDLIDDAILSSIADGILDNSVLESLELNWRMIGATKLHFFASMGPLFQRIRGTFCLDRF